MITKVLGDVTESAVGDPLSLECKVLEGEPRNGHL